MPAQSILYYVPGVLESIVEGRIRRFAGECRSIVVYWSGGKDSTAALLAARRALGYDVPAVFSMVPGQSDMSQVARLARALGYRLKPVAHSRGPVDPEPGAVHVVSADLGVDFWGAIERYGVPANAPGRRKRWCCQKFKSQPVGLVRHDCAVSAAKSLDSPWRRRLYSSLDPRVPARRVDGRLVLAPLFDVPDASVWALIRRYDERVYTELRRWYGRHPSSPDCRLCIVVSPGRFAAMAAAAPPGLRRRALRALRAVEPRLRPGTHSKCRVQAYIDALEESLAGGDREGQG